jgi:hypothetical protein
LLSKELEKIVKYMMEGLDDYEIDKKLGDVGAKVREASMRSLTTLLLTLLKSRSDIFLIIFQKSVEPYLCGLLKQLSEKMNKMRQAAGDSLQKFFFEISTFLKVNDYLSENLNKCIPNFQELSLIFLEEIKYNEADEIFNNSWLEPAYCFRKVTPLLLCDAYSFSIFSGLIISIGGITEDVQRCSLESFDDLLLSAPEKPKFVKKIFDHINRIFKNFAKEDRMIEPLYNAISHLLTKSDFMHPDFLPEVDQIHKSVMKENQESKNIYKILASVDIYYNMLFFEKENVFNLFARSLKSLLVQMTHT